MTLNLIAMLLSFAMMLTGAGAGGQEAQAARSLVLRNVSVSYNGEALRLPPEAHLGVAADGEKAVFDFGVSLNDETLLPIQVGVSDAGITALFAESDTAVTVPAQALERAMEAANQQLGDTLGAVQAENPELLSFLSDEFLPAYTGLLNATADSARKAEIGEAVKAVLDEKLDRGEGTPTTTEVEGETFDVTAYSYSLEGLPLAELADALYTAAPELSNYYNAIFKLYDMMPEESGLRGIDSFAACAERFGLNARLDVDELLSEDGELDITDAVMTVDLSAAVAAAEVAPVEEPAEEAEDAEAVEESDGDEAMEDAEEEVLPEPLVINLHTLQQGDYEESTASFTVDDGTGLTLDFELESAQETGAMQLETTITALQNGEKAARGRCTAYASEDDEGVTSYSLGLKFVAQDEVRLDASLYGARNPDGTSENSVAFDAHTQKANVEIAFDLDVTDDAIEDAANGHEADLVIDDLSAEGLDAMNQDGSFTATMLKVAASLNMDAFKLSQDSEVHKLITLLTGGTLPIDIDDVYDEEDDAYELDGDDLSYVLEGEDDGFEPEEVEDDGVLPFQEPRLSWLPQGWTVAETSVDTAYDWVELLVTDDQGEECAYALFFSDPETATTSYTVAEDGALLEGRGVSVTDFGEDGLSVTLRDGDMCGNLMFPSAAIDAETLGKIVAGVEF